MNKYEVIQELDRPPELVQPDLYEGHAAWDTVIGVLDISARGVKHIHLLNGYNGVKIHSYEMDDYYLPEDIHLTIQNNEIIVSAYNSVRKTSRIAKIETYASIHNNSPSLKTTLRHYTVQGRVVGMVRYLNGYYVTIVDGRSMKMCKSKALEFNNRRPLENAKYDSTFESKLVKKELNFHQNFLELRCILTVAPERI